MNARVVKIMLLALLASASLIGMTACGGTDSGSSVPAETPVSATPAEPAADPSTAEGGVSGAIDGGDLMTEDGTMDENQTETGSEPDGAEVDEPAHNGGEVGDSDREGDVREGGDDPQEPADPGSDSDVNGAEAASGYLIEVVDGEPVDGVIRITVKNGENATFTVSSNLPGEVHVHGVDVTKNVGPDNDADFSLETSFEGIFEIELHTASGEVEIAKLVIEPK